MVSSAKSASRHSAGGLQTLRRKLARTVLPSTVCVTSGWNCRPYTGSRLCRTAANGQVAVWASGTKSSAIAATWSPWLIQTSVCVWTPSNRSLASVTSQWARPYSREAALRDLAPERLAGELHPVADAQHRHAQREQLRVALRSARRRTRCSGRPRG